MRSATARRADSPRAISRSVTPGPRSRRADAAAWAVAALLDDLALNTPWGGASSAWPRQPLVVAVAGDVDAGAQFFDRLEKLRRRHPGRDRDLLELHYLCLALGFRGKYRVPGRAGDRLARRRQGRRGTLRARWRGAECAPLSPKWQGVVARDEPSRFIYADLGTVRGGRALGDDGLHLGLSWRLGGQAEELFRRWYGPSHPPERAEIYRAIRRDAPPDAPPVEPCLTLRSWSLNSRPPTPEGLRPALTRAGDRSRSTSLVIQWTDPGGVPVGAR
jgi:type VI secretion system protein ImpK